MNLGAFSRNQPFGQTKIHHLHVPFRREHDVGGLQIPVDDLLPVGCLQGLGYLHGLLEDIFQLQWTLSQTILQGLARYVLHRDEGLIPVFAHLMDVTDIG